MELLDYMEAKKLLDRYGIRSVESAYVESGSSAAKFAGGKPIVLKVISEKQLHKSKAGLVKLNLSGDKAITAAFNDLQGKAKLLKPYKIIAQKMAPAGIEIIVGGRTDPQFGHFVLIGLGGIYVEVFKDFALRLCPIMEYDAESMLDQLRSRKIITYNGKMDKQITKLLLGASKMLTENREIDELDINPLIVTANGYQAVDIRVLKKV